MLEVQKKKHANFRLRIMPVLLLAVLLAVPASVILDKMGFFTPAPTAQVTVTAASDAPELVFVADYDFDPYSFLNDDGSPNGMDVEIACEVANRLGMRPRIEFGTWNECKTKIKEGNADVLLGLEIFVDGAGTGTLKSIPVGADTLSIIGQDSIDDAAALSEKRVGVSFGSALMGLFRLNCEYVEYFTYSDMLKALVQGEIDYGICHASVATRIIEENKYNLKISLVLMESFPTMGIRQDKPELLAQINQVLEEMSASGTITALREKWIIANVQNRTVGDVLHNYQSFFIVYAILAVVVFAGYLVAVISYNASQERKQSLETVQKQQKQLESALDAAKKEQLRTNLLHDIIHSGQWTFFVNAKDEIIGSDVSEEANTILHNDVAADGHSWLDIVHPDDREGAAAAFNATIRDHSCATPYDVNYRMIDRDGVYRWFHSAGRIIRDSHDNGEFFGIHVDITEQMEEQQKRLLGAIPLSSDVLTKANIGLWAFEMDEGQAPRMYVDEAMLRLIGLREQLSPEETYQTWYNHIDIGSCDLVAESLEKMITGEHAEVQFPWHHPDGHTMIVRCGGVRNFEYTKGIRIEGTHQDVSETLHFDEEERKREAQQRKDEIARIEAESSNKAKTEFLFNMSHDIRTPMNAILGYTEIALNHTNEAERVSDSLRKIKLAGGHLLNLINDILEMSRIEAGKLEIAKTPVCVYDVTEGIQVMSQALASTKDISFRTEIGEMSHPYAYADELHTNQIIINLISNAIKYTNPGGTVEYRIEQISLPENNIARFRITVKDNGIGMTEAFQAHLFESFSREDSVAVSKQEGAGLGLAIVKRIVDILGGTISVQSRKGEGSVFTVELPFEVMDREAVERYKKEHCESETAFDVTVLKGRRVLLVEDNEFNREIADEILSEAGLEVDTAENGNIAVQKIYTKGANAYDFVLMDIQMPVMNGYEATAAIRELPGGKKLPIIALSANAFTEDKEASIAAGMDAHVAKPVNIQELLGVLARYL